MTRGLVELDAWGIDGSVSGLAKEVGRLSGAMRMAQTGFARSYALSMFAGAALVVAAILAVRFW
jgi:NADH-quinone oxidoreductase subunit L